MIKIRQNIFETNSSSVHAICVASESVENPMEITFKLGRFGWSFEYYSFPEERASYIYTAACALYGKDMYNKFENILEPLGFKCSQDYKNPPRFYNDGDDIYYLDSDCGYVDHVEDLEEFIKQIFNDPDMLVRFIFNNNSFVHTGNDNDDGVEDIYAEEIEAKEKGYLIYYKGN